MDNFQGSLLMAPLFVLIEAMFLLGYKPEFKQSMQALANEKIRVFKESKETKVKSDLKKSN